MASEVQTKGIGEANSQNTNPKLKRIQLVEEFVGPNAAYYACQFEQILQGGFAGIRLTDGE